MRVVAGLQVRFDSTRLPGKALLDLGGQTILDFTLLRYKELCSFPIYILTTDRVVDEPIRRTAQSHELGLLTGSEADVGERFEILIAKTEADVVCRVTGDNPFAAFENLELYANQLTIESADYLSNKIGAGFPMGADVEVFSSHAFLKSRSGILTDYQREHVTPPLYEGGEFRFVADDRRSDLLSQQRLTIDTVEDLRRSRRIVQRVVSPMSSPWEAFAIAAQLDLDSSASFSSK